MKNTKEKFIGRFWKGSKYIEEDYQEDLEEIIKTYSRIGYRDARILSEGMTWNDDNTININIDIEEGLPLINNDIYDVPSYHFNQRASYAFAARFNLFYEKWEKINF